MGYIRSNLFVPTSSFESGTRFNQTLLKRCLALSCKPHWLKGEKETSLFEQDKLALMGLPSHPFDVVRYERHKTDKLGRVRLESHHVYSVCPELVLSEVICGLRARNVAIFDSSGTMIAEHPRAYGAPTDTANPASQLALLARKPKGWQNSQVRTAFPENLKAYMDSLETQDLARDLRLLRDVSVRSGFGLMVQAASSALGATGRIDGALWP